MRKLIFIILLFFSTSALAESLKCSVEFPIGYLDKYQKYDLFIDIGNNERGMIAHRYENSNDYEGLAIINSVGKLFFDVGNPINLRGDKTEETTYFTLNTSYRKQGFFFSYGQPAIIELDKINDSEKWSLFISQTDTELGFGKTHEGICQ
jgi:hypothetical protein